MRKRRPRLEILGLLLSMAIHSVSACLSNPNLPCSVASSQPSCRAAHGAVTSFQQDSNIYATGQYTGFLGDRVLARAYSEMRSDSEFAVTDEELDCKNVTTCTWRNDPGDQLDWVTGFGEVAPTKLNIITGSTIMPGSNFFILASDARPASFAGSLISKPIACQPSSGLLQFRYWRSRARVAGQEPDLDICTRRVPDSTLENCLTVQPTQNHTILANIPPIFEPFEIVIRGYGFENEPEGGLILLDWIDYYAQLDTAENCAVREQNTIPPDAIVDEPTLAPTLHPTEELVRDEEKMHSGNAVSKDILIVPHDLSDNCKILECNLEESNDEGCQYRRVGTGAKGEGYRVGWKVAHHAATPSNPLTGIHSPPDIGSDPNFLVADFPGYAKSRKGHRFVLESPEFLLDDKFDAYLSFKKYMATQGIELFVCTDWREASSCFWDAFQNSADPFGRKWTREVVKLPNNINKFFIISTQDETVRANVGQIGISSIRIYSDAEATKPFC